MSGKRTWKGRRTTLLRRALTLEHIKPRLPGDWGTTPGLNFICVHRNRGITRHDLDMIFGARRRPPSCAAEFNEDPLSRLHCTGKERRLMHLDP